MSNRAEEIISNNDEIGAYAKLGLPLTIRAVKRGKETLSAPERQFLAVYQLHTDVNNGGFYGYFGNSAGDLVNDALLGLRNMGADRILDILKKACAFFPSGKVPATQGEREALFRSSAEDSARNRFQDAFETLDREFYGSADELPKIALGFVRSHVRDFHPD